MTDRTSSGQILSGGKGLNVSMALGNLGMDSRALGFLAGWRKIGDYGHAFRMGISAGSASAYSERLAVMDEIRNLYKRLSRQH